MFRVWIWVYPLGIPTDHVSRCIVAAPSLDYRPYRWIIAWRAFPRFNFYSKKFYWVSLPPYSAHIVKDANRHVNIHLQIARTRLVCAFLSKKDYLKIMSRKSETINKTASRYVYLEDPFCHKKKAVDRNRSRVNWYNLDWIPYMNILCNTTTWYGQRWTSCIASNLMQTSTKREVILLTPSVLLLSCSSLTCMSRVFEKLFYGTWRMTYEQDGRAVGSPTSCSQRHSAHF